MAPPRFRLRWTLAWIFAAFSAIWAPATAYGQDERPKERDAREVRARDRESNRNERLDRETDRLGKGDERIARDSDRITRDSDKLTRDRDKLTKDDPARDEANARLQENARKGKEWETTTQRYLEERQREKTYNQVTVEASDGTRSRADLIYRNSEGKYVLVECKASDSAGYTRNQREVFRRIDEGQQVTVRGARMGEQAEGQKIRISEIYVSRPDEKGNVRLERYPSAEVRAEP